MSRSALSAQPSVRVTDSLLDFNCDMQFSNSADTRTLSSLQLMREDTAWGIIIYDRHYLILYLSIPVKQGKN